MQSDFVHSTKALNLHNSKSYLAGLAKCYLSVSTANLCAVSLAEAKRGEFYFRRFDSAEVHYFPEGK